MFIGVRAVASVTHMTWSQQWQTTTLQSVPHGQNQVSGTFFFFFEKFILDIRHNGEEKMIATSVSCWYFNCL